MMDGDEDLVFNKSFLQKHLMLLSRGGKVQRSHKKRVGNIVNRNIEKRYNALEKMSKRIKDIYNR